ncbi:MoaF C-terminal domain-containing protein [Okibacterium endophyticum]
MPTAGPPESMAANRLPSTDALDGGELALELVDGGMLSVAIGGGRARWAATGVGWQGGGDDPVDVVEAAPELYFIDIDFTEFDRMLEAVSIVWDRASGWALLVHQRRFHPEETWSRGPEVLHDFSVARVAGSKPAGTPPAVTRELIGRRHLYRYSPNNLYEHIYLSSQKFCAHNVHTFGTPGRADCHPVSYYKMRDDVFVVTWREYDSAVGMVTVLDLDAGRSSGKAHDPEHFLRSTSRPFGGFITEITDAIDYPDGLQPL